MDAKDLRTLLDYHYWARDRVLDAAADLSSDQFLRDLRSSFRSIRDTLVHLVASETNWCLRWRGQAPTTMLPPENFPDVAAIRGEWRRLESEVRRYVEEQGERGLDRVYRFVTLSGQPTESTLWQMVQHMANHGSYHRGQITTMLRQLGAQPPKSLDMIAFYQTSGARSGL
jgi:uncharacterized damage-inducible protein DinB